MTWSYFLKLVAGEVLIGKLIMSKIKTLVYFDIEATGLKSSGRPRISELTLVAVNIEDFLEVSSQMKHHFPECTNRIESMLPRVMNKLTICVYPMASIRPEVSEITGLDNYNLSGQSTFDRNTGELINNFLVRLPAPLCLIAHNGDLYDFPLLMAELEKAEISLLSETLCADSYVGIKDIFKRREESIQSMIDKKSQVTDLDKQCKDLESENSNTLKKGLSFSKVGSKRCKYVSLPNVSKSLKFTKRQIKFASTTNSRLNDHTAQLQNTGIFKSKKRMDSTNIGSPSSYSLINLHKHLLGCYPTKSHGAEADCLALLKTTAMLGREWLKWVEESCQLFSNCKQMWSLKNS